MNVQSYKDLEVWKKSMGFVKNMYSLTARFPKEEIYGLTSQIRRAAVSVPSNIAEGRAKRSTREFMRFINMACGSVAELETQLMISQDLGFLNREQLDIRLKELEGIARMLNGLHAGLEKRLPSNP